MRYLLLLIASALFVMGVVMIFSTTSAEILDHDLDLSTHYVIFRHLIFALLGAFCAFGMYRLGFRRFLQYSPLFFVLITLLLVMVLLPGVGREVNGSRRWLNIPGLSLQPSEFIKLVIPAFFIYRLAIYKDRVLTFQDFFRLLLPIGVPLALILIEPNNGTVFVIVASLVVLFFLSGISFKFWAVPLVAAALVGGAFASQLPYVTGRIKVYLNPELDIRGKGHQPHQAKIAAGSGKLFGKGPGKSWQKLSYLPEAQNDYIAAIYAEEFGFLGMMALIVLYMFLALAGISIAYHAPSAEGMYLAAALTFLISFQAFLNLGVVSGLLPSTGLNLPLFSQGGSSLMANLMGIGLLMSIGEEKGT